MKLTILCLNLWEGGILWDNIVNLLKREVPDIMCFQEAFNAKPSAPLQYQTVNRMRELLPLHYHAYAPELYEIRPDGEGDTGNLIISQYPISYYETIFLFGDYQTITRPKTIEFSHYPKNMQCAHITLPNTKELHVHNVHGIWGLDGRDSPERLRMSHIITTHVTDKQNVIVAGDFNLKPDTQTIDTIEQKLTNVFKGAMTSSFNMKHKSNPGYATAVVDMVFISPEVMVVDKKILEDDVSDHKGLLLTVDIS